MKELILLIVSQFGVPNWQINIVSEPLWSQAIRVYDVADKTETAATLYRKRYTVLRKSRIEKMTRGELRELLAHEAGHIVCQCADESRADVEARKLINRQN